MSEPTPNQLAAATIRRSCEEIGCLGPTHRATFANLWDKINGERATWASNPPVWVIDFRRVRP